MSFGPLTACFMCGRPLGPVSPDVAFCGAGCGRDFREMTITRPDTAHTAPRLTDRRVSTPPRRYLDCKGYVRIGTVYEHRLVAAFALGRPLDRDEQVHHRNGDRTDNRPSNLEVLTQAEHARRHAGDAWQSARNRNRTATDLLNATTSAGAANATLPATLIPSTTCEVHLG